MATRRVVWPGRWDAAPDEGRRLEPGCCAANSAGPQPAGVIKYAFSEAFNVATASYEVVLQSDLSALRAGLAKYDVGTSEHANIRAELEAVETAAAAVQARQFTIGK